MLKPIYDFIGQFNAHTRLEESLIIKKNNRFFLLNRKMKKILCEDFYYAGTYLGKIKKNHFFPSFNLLSLIAMENANKITVDEKTEWLFICGRDVFKQGITSIAGSGSKGNHTLIMNQHGECLGFGRILHDIAHESNLRRAIIENVLDIGDFLRRERQVSYVQS
jgi:ribosome biogenesis protein Nip4